MNKEEAKKRLHNSRWGADTSNYRDFMNFLDAIIDSIEPEHEPARHQN